MRVTAARLVEHGKPVEVEDTDLPGPGDGEVVIEMCYSGVNPVDRYGALGRAAAGAPLPRTLGTEGVGLLDGRPYLVRGHGLGTARDGLWASAAVVPRAALIEVPGGVDLVEAAAVGVAGVTAWRVVTELADIQPHDVVLVLGASGGVGSTVVSAAARLGATVIGQTGSQAKADWVRGRGASRVIVAGADELEQALDGQRPTVVFDPLGGAFTGAAIGPLHQRGRLVLFGTSAGAAGTIPLQSLYRKAAIMQGYAGLIESDETMAMAIRRTLDALANERFSIAVADVLPLSDVSEAFARIEQRVLLGNLVLDNQKE
jgi:NADPH2:quinone reductase